MKFLLVVAMTEEIEPLRDVLKPKLIDRFKHVRIEQAEYKGHDFYLVESGIGKANAAMGTTLGIERFHPDVIFNYGVVGALRETVRVGDVVVPNEFCYHDADDTAFGSPLGRVPRMPHTYPLHQSLQVVLDDLLKSFNHIKTGQDLTSDTFMYKEDRIQFVRESFPEGIVVEMEASAIAQVAYTYDIPFLSVKSISDDSSSSAPKEYLEAKDQTAINAAETFFHAVDSVIKHF